LCIIWV